MNSDQHQSTSAGIASNTNPKLPAKRKKHRDYKKEDSGRNSNLAWLKEFPWLRDRKTIGAASELSVYCNVCSLKADELCIIKNPKLDQLKQHERAKKHTDAIVAHPLGEFDAAGAIFAAAAKANPEKSVVQWMLEGEGTALDAEFEHKLIQFMLAFGILKNARPMVDYEYQQEILLANPKTRDCMPTRHSSDDLGWEIAEALAEVTLKDTRNLVKDCAAFGLTLDASAAIDNVDYMNLEARVWAEGRLHLAFLELRPLGLRTSAAGQFELVMEALPEILDMSVGELERKLSAIASDGCNTMQGSQGGLCTLVEKQFPHIVKISCTAHKVNLAAEILDEQLQFRRISNLVRDIATYFNRSPKRAEPLRQYQEKLGLKILKLIKVNETRWMPVKKALDNVLSMLPALLLALDAERKEKSDEVCLLNVYYKYLIIFIEYLMSVEYL